MAAGTAAVLTAGTELCRRADVERIYHDLKQGSPEASTLSTSPHGCGRSQSYEPAADRHEGLSFDGRAADAVKKSAQRYEKVKA